MLLSKKIGVLFIIIFVNNSAFAQCQKLPKIDISFTLPSDIPSDFHDWKLDYYYYPNNNRVWSASIGCGQVSNILHKKKKIIKIGIPTCTDSLKLVFHHDSKRKEFNLGYLQNFKNNNIFDNQELPKFKLKRTKPATRKPIQGSRNTPKNEIRFPYNFIHEHSTKRISHEITSIEDLQNRIKELYNCTEEKKHTLNLIDSLRNALKLSNQECETLRGEPNLQDSLTTQKRLINTMTFDINSKDQFILDLLTVYSTIDVQSSDSPKDGIVKDVKVYLSFPDLVKQIGKIPLSDKYQFLFFAKLQNKSNNTSIFSVEKNNTLIEAEYDSKENQYIFTFDTENNFKSDESLRQYCSCIEAEVYMKVYAGMELIKTEEIDIKRYRKSCKNSLKN